MMKPTPVIATFVLLLVCAFTSILAFAKTPTVPASQVVFEGVGSGTFNSQAMQFGFSVRCYGASCVGALVLGGPTALTYVTGTVTQLQPDTYMMSLSTIQSPTGTLPPTNSTPSISCSLANAPPVTQGETNTVTMICSSPVGSGTSTDAAVEVLAPSNAK
jgi:hypothetical protein